MEDTEHLQFRFRRGQADADALQAVVDETLTELGDPGSQAADDAKRAGLDPAELTDSEIRVHEDSQGMDPVLAAILISFGSKMAEKAAEALWDKVFWPRIRKRLGPLAVGDRTEP